ncbi:MAG: hypothetical protein KDD46_01380 [Bdellovibrionales bacterium]|nr:hypothetical protein [Bdellovibrionales bacterium]
MRDTIVFVCVSLFCCQVFAGFPVPIVDDQPSVQTKISLRLSESQIDHIEDTFEKAQITTYQHFRNQDVPVYSFMIKDGYFDARQASVTCRYRNYKRYALFVDGLEGNGFSFQSPEDCFAFMYIAYQRFLQGDTEVVVYLDWKRGWLVVENDLYAEMLAERSMSSQQQFAIK